MDHSNKIMAVAVLLALLHEAEPGGYPKKVQIHVPHNIQHHHHTHTKYHFITLPAVRPPIQTNVSSTPTPAPPIIMPVMPVIPGMMFPNNTPGAQPPQPTAAAPPAPATPAPQQPNFAQIPNFFPINPNAMYIHDYDYVDTPNRRSREKVIRVEQPMPPMKFKTVINVQETKKIPLSELFNINHLIPREPPRRIKVDVYPEKTAHIKQTQKIMNEWHALQEALKAKPYPGLNPEQLELDTEAFQTRLEIATERPELEALKNLLEKHIHEDFPGLNVKADIKQYDGPVPTKEVETGADERSGNEDSADSSSLEFKHIGYIVVDDKKNHHFVSVNDPSVT